MLYLRWTEENITGLSKMGLTLVVTEVTADGRVKREVSLDEAGRVFHRAPSKSSPYGLFDNALISVEGKESECSEEEFEALWIRWPQERARTGSH